MALSEIDRHLLERCLARKPRAWEDFVDRYMGLVVHVVNHSAHSRSIHLTPEDRDDLCGDVLLAIIRDDFAVLRRFRGQSSLATYLAVVARRVVVKRLIDSKAPSRLSDISAAVNGEAADHGFDDRDEVERLLEHLTAEEADAMRMFHLEGRNYQAIASALGVSENSIGPLLSRARQRMREMGAGARG